MKTAPIDRPIGAVFLWSDALLRGGLTFEEDDVDRVSLKNDAIILLQNQVA